jgi:hypothetical protein
VSPNIRLTLDTTAVLSYAYGGVDVGELIAEVVDEGAQFAASVLCLAEAARDVTPEALARVEVLAKHPAGANIDLPGWRYVGVAARVYGSVSRAATALAAGGLDAYVVTTEPEMYPGLPTVGI